MFDTYVETRKDLIIIFLQGDFYLERIKEVKELWNKQADLNPETVAINCSELEHVDSSGIATFFKIFEESSKRDIKLLFYDLSPAVQQLFKIARLEKFFTIMSKDDFEEQYQKNL